MIKQLYKFLTQRSFKNLLTTTYFIGIALLITIATLVTSNLSSRSVHDSLNKTGLQLVESFANNSRIALLYLSEAEAQLVVESILSFPDVKAAGIYNDKMQVIYQSSDLSERQTTTLPTNSTLLDYENENEWTYSSPVFSTHDEETFLYSDNEFEPKLLGYVRLTVSKNVLSALKNDFYKYNLIVISVLALLLLWALLIITKRISKPIENLAQNMLNAAEGNVTDRKSIGSTQDIMRMEQAFTDMMHILENREKELVTTRDIAIEAAKVKSEFAANVSHELRTPLNGISGMLELLSDMNLTTQQKEYLKVASTSANSLLGLIDDVLDFSKYDQHDVALHEESFNLRNTLENSITLLSTQTQRKNISIAYFLNSDVPINLIADELRLQQILQNLLGNAIKFTHTGEVSVTTSISLLHESNITLLFEVKDTGIGIPQEVQDKIFNAFSQADNSTTREFGGTGLGLAISRQLVTIFGGEMGVNSEVGKGSTFWFTANFIIDKQANEQKQSNAPTMPSHLNILYVGDDDFSSRFIEQQFQALSYFSDHVSDGPGAIKKMRQHKALKRPYDFVLIDKLHSSISQTALIRMINADNTLNETKIIALVANNSTHFDSTKELNVFGHISRPVKQSDLILNFSTSTTLKTTSLVEQAEVEEHLPEYKFKNILVVEDNKANQLVAKAMLERFKCNITLANDGLEALELFSTQAFDLILMDCQMPEMDGYEATFQIRELETQGTHTPIVALTANKQSADREQCIAAGMDDFMAKPLTLMSLKNTLQRWISLDAIKSHPKQRIENDTLIKKVLDETSYLKRQETLGPEFKTELETFLEETPLSLTKLKMDVSQLDRANIKRITASIKSSASNIAALRLSQACQKLENACGDGEAKFLNLQHKIIVFEAELVIKEVSSRLSELDTKTMELNQRFSPAKILLIDTDKRDRSLIKNALEDTGHNVDEVINNYQGELYCERNTPDMVILEHASSNDDHSFNKICHELSSNNIPFTITSNQENETSINNAFQVGALDYFSKPLNLPLFIHRINRILTTKQNEKQIFDLAHKDHLTGLMNRSLFTKRATELIAKHEREEKIMAIIFLDLDRFKLVNDSYGHEAGDLLLKIVAERLSRSVREVDIISRFGGDEFVIALTDVKSHHIIETLARKIQNNLSRPFVFLEKEMHVNASLGISVFPTTGDNISNLIKNADIAMYSSKQSKTPYVFFDDTMTESINKRLVIENELRNVILRDELKVFYQPQFNVSTGELVGMEALVRWLHPEKGLIPPNDFIGLAEETGQIHMIGEWVLETACSALKKWLDRGAKPIRVAVNLSTLQLEDEGIVNKISSILETTQLPHHLLELEITESSVMNNEQLMINKLNILKNLGIKLAIDDFGTGYSSLSYLKRLPINLLKIDRSFVNNSLNNKVDIDIIRTIIVLAHSMGIEVIAEGVETEEQSTLLKSLNCDYVQGYYFGKPMPTKEFEKLFFNKVIDNVYPITLLQ